MTDPARAAPAGEAAPRASRWRMRLSAVGFALVLLVVLGEVGMRRWKPAKPLPVRAHPLCWHVHSPDLELTIGDVDTGEKFVYRTNRFGFRGANMKDEKHPKDNSYRIIFVGGSTTMGWGVPEERTFCGLVEAELERRRAESKDPTAPRVEVANSAIYANPSAAVYSMLVHEVLPHEPDLVVFMIAINDLRMSLRKDWDEENHYWPSPVPESPAFSDWLCGVSGFARGVRGVSRRLGLTSPDPDDGGFPSRKPVQKGVDMKRGLAGFRRYLHLTALACKDAKVDLAFMTEASIYKDVLSPEETKKLWMMNIGDVDDGPNCDVQEFRKGLEAYDEEVRVASAREGARLVDLAKDGVIAKDLAHFYDDVHLTKAGHAAAAKEILNVVFGEKPAQKRP